MNIKYAVAILLGLCAVASSAVAISIIFYDKPDCKKSEIAFLTANEKSDNKEKLLKEFKAACEK